MSLFKPLLLLSKITLATLALTALAACDDGGSGGSGGGGGSGGSGGGTTTSAGECQTGGGEAPVGPCLVAAHAGAYAVTATAGAHTRGTITIGDDGSIDYDTDLQFPIDDYEGVYDRLECCNRISVEMKQRPDNDTSLAPDARHRVDVFTASSTVGSAVVSFDYYPNWPSENGKVVLDVAD
jgi:hypothetical protein